MIRTLTGAYSSIEQARNVEDELRSSGMPREKIYIDEESKTIKVMIPDATVPGVLAILERHCLDGIKESC